MHRILCLLSVGLLSAVPDAAGQAPASGQSPARGSSGEDARLTVQAVRIVDAPLAIDGRLDEAIWAEAEPVTGFVQMRPSPGEPESERTEARVLFDDRYLYVGMRMYDRQPEQIAAQLARRDATGIHSDWAHVLIDSYNDRRTAFRFSVNPRGVQKDVLHHDDYNEDLNWDAVWEVATQIDSLGWTAEFRIRLSQLRYSGEVEGERVWGVNFGREIARRGEWSWWSPVLPTAAGIVSPAGELRGLTGIRTLRRLEVLPYSVARLTRAPGDGLNPFYRSNDGRIEAGADLRYGLTSNFTLSATLNPDFGQVEADPSEFNLSAFESFFAEKRPFFIEGANIFSFNIGVDDGSGEQLFYSRRIGRAPQRFVDAGEGWAEAPEATRILGAAKLSGKTAQGWTVGFLNAVTNAEHARVASRTGEIVREPVEPLTNYAVLSLSRDFRRGQSTLGVLGTATNRRLGDGAEFEFLRSSAYTGGVTGRHRFADGAWEASAYLAGSHIRGSREAIARVQRAPGHYFQRPDAAHLEFDSTRTTLSGAVANFGLWKIGGSKLRGGVGGHLRTPGLEVNDLGFQGEADMSLLFGNLRYHQFEPKGIFRSWMIGLNPSAGWTTGGEHFWTQLGNFSNFELKNFWSGGWWLGKRFQALNTGALRGGPAVVRPGGLRWSVWLNSDRRRPLALSLESWGGRENDTGTWDYGIGTGLTFRPSAQLNLSLQPSLSRNNITWQYVAQPGADGSTPYVLGHLDQTTLQLTTRVNYTISPTLSFQLYAQPFVSAGSYDDFMEVSDPRAERFAERFRRYSAAELSFDPENRRYGLDLSGDGSADLTFRDPDFNFRELRTNAVLRWEYRPGSTLFLVWSQGRTGFERDGSFRAGRDLDRLFQVEPTNVLLVKLNYWLNL